jgi:alpha-tubulin suppressor-like RCC1 family protein
VRDITEDSEDSMRMTSCRRLAVTAIGLFLAACGDVVRPDPVRDVLVLPDSAVLLPGETQQFTATPRNADGNVLPASVVWSTSDSSVATVDQTGLVTAVAVGAATITAASGDTSGVARVRVESGGPAPERNPLSAGIGHTCALDTDGAAYCWGWNHSGQLGVGDRNDRLTPTPVAGGLRFASIQAGASHACGLTFAGESYCWGSNNRGALGIGTFDDALVPARLPTHVFRALDLGANFSVALTPEGLARSWGENNGGKLGDSTREHRATPVRVTRDLRYQSVSAGNEHACALDPDGFAYCWGANDLGPVGDGTAGVDRLGPARVAGGLTLVQVVAGAGISLGRAADGRAWGWGANYFGENGTGAARTAPAPLLGDHRFAHLAAGFADHACGVTIASAAYCWGSTQYGQLGNGQVEYGPGQPAPVQVLGGLSFRTIAVGHSHTCGLTTTGEVYCWGANSLGNLGDGTRTDRSTPTRATFSGTFGGRASVQPGGSRF